MDGKLLYWTGALVNMGVLVFFASAGVRAARRGSYRRHRTLMLVAVALVIAFLLSYPAKLAIVGREALDTWEASYVWILRIHELCVLVMTLAGATALFLAKRLGLPLDAPPTDPAIRRRVRLHHRMGWTAVVAASLGVVTASFVLFGMYGRL